MRGPTSGSRGSSDRADRARGVPTHAGRRRQKEAYIRQVLAAHAQAPEVTIA